jgi:phosphatidate cytidylyltransferase
MLKQRILTTAVLVPLLVAALFYLPLPGITVLFGIITAVAAWEWARLSGLQRFPLKASYVLFLLLLGVAGLYGVLSNPSLMFSFSAAAVLWWLWVLVEIVTRREISKGMFSTIAGRMVGGFLVLVPLWVASVYLMAVDVERPRALLFLFVLVWMADTAAYFTGSLLGKTKLAPHISPGKTVEGVAGGVMGAVLLAWLCGTMLWKFDSEQLVRWIGLAVITVLFSVVGDLTESKLKRVAGVKDSGSLLPGHGGMLDRIDALSAAAPVFVFGGMILLKS